MDNRDVSCITGISDVTIVMGYMYPSFISGVLLPFHGVRLHNARILCVNNASVRPPLSITAPQHPPSPISPHKRIIPQTPHRHLPPVPSLFTVYPTSIGRPGSSTNPLESKFNNVPGWSSHVQIAMPVVASTVKVFVELEWVRWMPGSTKLAVERGEGWRWFSWVKVVGVLVLGR